MRSNTKRSNTKLPKTKHSKIPSLKLWLQLPVFGLVSSITHASENYFPPIEAFEEKPYKAITLGFTPDFKRADLTFPELAPSDVVAFYIDHENKVKTIFCEAIITEVTPPTELKEINKFTKSAGNTSSNSSLKVSTTSLDSGTSSKNIAINTQSFESKAGTQSINTSISVISESVEGSSSSQKSKLELATNELENKGLSTEQKELKTVQTSQINEALSSESKQISTEQSENIQAGIDHSEANASTSTLAVNMTGALGEATTSETSVFDSVSVSGFKNTQQSTAIHEVFTAAPGGIEKYFDDFFKMWLDETGSFAIVDEEGNPISYDIDGNDLALIEAAKKAWFERVQRFSFDDDLRTYLSDFPTDEFRTRLTLPENPETKAGITCSYTVPSNLWGINFAHPVGVRFEVKNEGNVPITDLLVAMSPAKYTKYLTANERREDVTSYIPSVEIVLHRLFWPIPTKSKYITEFLIETDPWHLPKPPVEEKGFF